MLSITTPGNEIINIEDIRKLALKQPYANLVVYHDKIETRTWGTNYRGWVLITSSKSAYSNDTVKQISGSNQYQRIFEREQLFLNGCAIGIGKLIDCRKMQSGDEDKCFVEYYPELFCHVYEKFYPIKPFQIKNAMKWGKLSEDEFQKINFK